MSQSVVLTGMVLSAMPVGDFDKRITILTKERGKITAFARGARRPNSQLMAGSNPFSFGEFELFEGKSAYSLSKVTISNYFRRAVFELKAITINGEGPSLFSCIHCHSREGLNVFSARRGGVFCDNCGTQVQGRHILSDTLYTMQYIVSADITKLYTFAVSDDVLEELRSIMKEYLSIYVHHDFKSAAFL